MTTYQQVTPNALVDKLIYDRIKSDIEAGISSKVGIKLGVNFKNTLAVTSGTIITNLADAVDPQDALNVQSNRAPGALDIGNIILYHGDDIPAGFALCDGNIPKECALGLTTPKLPDINGVKHIIRIY